MGLGVACECAKLVPRSQSIATTTTAMLGSRFSTTISIRIPSRRSRLRHIPLILDLRLPDMTGLELQTRLANRDGPPIIFLTGHGDIPTTVKAMKGGAAEFLLKPFDEDDLVRAIDAAIAFDCREKA